MKARSFLFENIRSAVDNGRGHSVVMDLPPKLDGQDTGATALEVALMSLSGCITTIFSTVAHNKGVTFEKLLCELEAEKSDQKGIDNVVATLKVVSPASEKDLKKVFRNTLAACPVGKIFKSAGINLIEKLEKVEEFE